MIINTSTTAPFNNVSPAPARQSKPVAQGAAEGADEAQISSTGEQLAVSEDNFNAVGSQIQDVDAADASMEYARKSILGQPALAMQAQANSIAQSALRLLQE